MHLTIYSRPGCHLCDEMKSLVHRFVAQHSGLTHMNVDEIDIETDRELCDRYGLEIPVLLIDGKKVAKYRISEEELARMVEARDRGKR